MPKDIGLVFFRADCDTEEGMKTTVSILEAAILSAIPGACGYGESGYLE